MTTNHHTAISTGASANAATINSPLAELDANIYDGVYLPAFVWGAANGTPVTGQMPDDATGAVTWECDDTNQEDISCAFPYDQGAGGSTITVQVSYAMESATSGDVRLISSVAAIADGEDFGATEDSQTVVNTVPGTAEQLRIYTFTHTVTYAVGDIIRIRFTRTGDHASDTATGNLHFICAQVIFS